MSLAKSLGQVLGRGTLCALLVASGATVSVEAAADSSSDADAHSAFVSMVGKLEKAVSGAKSRGFPLRAK